jgi:erythritol transport system permease protein
MTRTEAAQFLLRGRAFIALIVLAVFFAFMESAFLTGANIEILIKQTALNAILAIGMTFVILTGGIDLAVGSIVGHRRHRRAAHQQGLEGVLTAGGLPHTRVLVISLAAGTFLGAISGFIITLQRGSFITAVLLVGAGWRRLISRADVLTSSAGDLKSLRLPGLGRQLAGIVPWAIVLMVLFAVMAWFVTTRTPFGRAVAVGQQRSAGSQACASTAPDDRLQSTAFCAATGAHHRLQLWPRTLPTGRYFILRHRSVVLGGASLSVARLCRQHAHQRLRHRHPSNGWPGRHLLVPRWSSNSSSSGVVDQLSSAPSGGWPATGPQSAWATLPPDIR